jgi:DNA-binding NarL/FixJ family response regulator
MSTNAHSIRSRPRLPPPAELDAARIVLGDDEFLLLAWPLSTPQLPPRLTRAERQIARLLLDGLSNPEIARRRATSVSTVANQVASLLSKLGVRSRLELFAMSARGTRARNEGGER